MSLKNTFIMSNIFLLFFWFGGCGQLISLCSEHDVRACKCLGIHDGTQSCKKDKGWGLCECTPYITKISDGGAIRREETNLETPDASTPPESTHPDAQKTCPPGSRPCYSGPSGTSMKGLCRTGCQAYKNNSWGICEGQVLPKPELCDGLDNDCNGQIDEHNAVCFSWLNLATSPKKDSNEDREWGAEIFSMAIDKSGQIYITGGFRGVLEFGDTSFKAQGQIDMFVAKLDANGKWLWVITAGSTDDALGLGLALNADGNIILTGFYEGSLKLGSISLPNTATWRRNSFVTMLEPDGKVVWVSTSNGLNSQPCSVTIGKQGSIYITGNFDHEVSFGASQLVSEGMRDLFVAKLSKNGSWLWARSVGSPHDEFPKAMATSKSGDLYLTGYFTGPVQFGKTKLTLPVPSLEYPEIFVARMDRNGEWLWASSAGSKYSDNSRSITIDEEENAYITGDFDDRGTFGEHVVKVGYLFVAKISPTGKWLWATDASPNISTGNGIKIDTKGNLFVLGEFKKTVQFGKSELVSKGEQDVFIAQLDTNGKWLWAGSLGSSHYDDGQILAIDEQNSLYIAGLFLPGHTAKRPIPFGDHLISKKGHRFAYIAKILRKQ